MKTWEPCLLRPKLPTVGNCFKLHLAVQIIHLNCLSTKYIINTEETNKLGYPELCRNQLDCFYFVLNLVGVEQN